MVAVTAGFVPSLEWKIRFEFCGIREYFRKKKVYNKENHTIKKYHDLSSSERKLVQTAQGLSMLGALLKKDSSVKVTNLGSLLLRHINDIILEDVKDRSFETYLKEIAYHMVLVGRFDLSLKELQKYFKSKGVINCNPILENVYVKKLFNKDVRGNYEWIHQNHRDLYCGLKLCDLAVEIDNNIAEFTPNNVTTNDEILTLCGDVISDDRLLQESIYKLKNISSFDYSYALSVLVKIFAYKNNNSIYGLNLAGLDLSKISLAGYILYSKSSEESEGVSRISSKAIILDDAIVSDNSDIVLHSTTNDSFVIVRNDFLSEYGEENFSVCKLSYTSNYLYYSWGNVIYRCLLSNITDNVEFDPWLTFENKCIFDMYLTQDYCIVNLGKIISIYSFDKQLICSYTYEEKGHTKQDKLKRFTKISPLEEYKNKIILLPQLNLATIHKPLKPNRRKMETSLLPTNQKRQSLVGLSIVGVKAEDQDRNIVPPIKPCRNQAAYLV